MIRKPRIPPGWLTAPWLTRNNASTKSEIQAMAAGRGSVIPLCYGNITIGPLLTLIERSDYSFYTGRDIVLRLVWGLGEWASIDEVILGDAPAPASVRATHYLGTDAQGVDPVFANLIDGYDDTLVKVIGGKTFAACYSRVEISNKVDDVTNFNGLLARGWGRKVLDPRDGLVKKSNNPSLILRDFIVNFRGKTVPDADVIACADANDELMSDGSKRRTLGIAYTTVRPAEAIQADLAMYAGVITAPEGNKVRMIPDRPVSSIQTITDSHILENTFRFRKSKARDKPTIVRAIYTNTTRNPWEDDITDPDSAVQRPGVSDGSVERRMDEVSVPGIQTHQQARRFEIERLNRYWLSDLTVNFTTRDRALQDQIGDVHDLSTTIGIDKPMRLVLCNPIEPGRWDVEYQEYDPAIYSDSVVNAPTFPDTSLPDPDIVPDVGPLTITEEVFTTQTGTYESRFRITWDDVDYFYRFSYRTRVLVNDEPVAPTIIDTLPVAVTPAVQEGVEYEISVQIVSDFGSVGAETTQTKTAQGKQLIPGDVPQVSAARISGNIVRVEWEEAIDIDIWRYAVRVGLITDTWETATFIGRTDSLSLDIPGLQTGTHRVFVKAVDSIGQLSNNATFDDVILRNPQKVSGFTGFEIGGETRLQWTANPASDFVERYEVRYGQVSGFTWAGATKLDSTDSLRLATKDIAEGTWLFAIKAVQSNDGESAEYASATVDVSKDEDAFVAAQNDFTAPTLTNAISYKLGRDDPTYYVTSIAGDTWNALFPNAMNTYTDPLFTYRSAGASEWLSETFDAGIELTGTWRLTESAIALSGTVSVFLELSLDNITWVQYEAVTVQATARYSRVRIAA